MTRRNLNIAQVTSETAWGTRIRTVKVVITAVSISLTSADCASTFIVRENKAVDSVFNAVVIAMRTAFPLR